MCRAPEGSGTDLLSVLPLVLYVYCTVCPSYLKSVVLEINLILQFIYVLLNIFIIFTFYMKNAILHYL